MSSSKKTPVTVFTGFLGSGKTTIILDILKKTKLKTAVIKNEFGDAKVDSSLFQQSSLKVEEFSNGCLCCTSVGQLEKSLDKVMEYQPDWIIVETSGSAFPAPIALLINSLDKFQLDLIVCVVDCENFPGYEDVSYTAKIQASYTDLIMYNKFDGMSERDLDLVVDKVNELNLDTPKVWWSRDFNADIILGFDKELLHKPKETTVDVDTSHFKNEIDLISIRKKTGTFDRASFDELLSKLDKEVVYRVKGIFLGQDVLNWAFGRSLWNIFTGCSVPNGDVKKNIVEVTVMGSGLFQVKRLFLEYFNTPEDPDLEFNFTPAR